MIVHGMVNNAPAKVGTIRVSTDRNTLYKRIPEEYKGAFKIPIKVSPVEALKIYYERFQSSSRIFLEPEDDDPIIPEVRLCYALIRIKLY